MERILAFDRAIRDGAYPNATSMARRFEVCRRTVQRDLEFLRDRLGAPLVFVPERNGFAYADPAYRLPTLNLTEGEIFALALALAQRVLQQYEDAPLLADLKRAVEKVATGLSDKVKGDLAAYTEAFSFQHSSSVPTDGETLRVVSMAVGLHQQLHIRYWTASRDEETDRVVDPYRLLNVDGRFYLAGYCHLRGAVRIFSAWRIRAIATTGRQFSPPDDFRLEEFLKGAFEILRGDDRTIHSVALRFRGEATRYVRERVWHPSQTVETQADGGLIFRFKLGHLREIERFALSWGTACEVLEPPELRHRVAAEIASASRVYGST